jgi:hypothetical protein
MFPWYIDTALVVLILVAFGAIWGVGGNAASAEPKRKG